MKGVASTTISANITGSGGMLGNSGRGAGIFNLFGNLTVDTSTISGNITGRGLGSAASRNGTGGGLFNQTFPTETVNLLNDTIAFNEIDVNQKGAGINNLAGTVTLKNTIVAHNYTAAALFSVHDCSGTINLQGYNMIFLPDATCIYIKSTGDQDYIDPLLRPLQFNGGPTPTHGLPANSPAVDAGDNNTCHSTDQRGFQRPVNGGKSLRCDIGAYEFYPIALFLPLVLRSL